RRIAPWLQHVLQRAMMKFSHSEEDREGKHLDVLTDEENGLRIIVSRLGAELVSLARVNEAGEWTGFLYRDNDLSVPSQGWANHATVMGYYLHRLKDGRSLYRGREIKGGNHGFLRSKTWHFAGTSRQGSGASHRVRRWRNAVFQNGITRFHYPGIRRCAEASIFLCRSAQRPLGDSRFNGRTVPDPVVRRRTIPLHRTLLGAY